MAPNYAFVTLITSDSYLPGALALAGALKDVHPSPVVPPEVEYETVCLVTPETVDVSTIKLLRRAFTVVIGVEPIGQHDDKGLKLLGRPDLHTVLTKLHVFRLTQYSKVIFLDADVLPIRPLSHLFTLPYEFSAAPDVGWPDIFNSGVMVLTPGEDKFTELNQLLKTKGSWDGGDQGLLNEWRRRDWNRLSFTYNTTPTAAYTYAPAYERYGSQISAIHFIGPNKPWNLIAYRAPSSSSQQSTQDADLQSAYDYNSLVDRWFSVYDRHYRSQIVVPETEFEVKKYLSAWDETGSGAEMLATTNVPTGGALGLEDLRRVAIEGISSSSLTVDDHSGEGEYRSMPLEGRVDLIRTRPPLEEEEEILRTDSSPSTPLARSVSFHSDSLPRMETLPTPGPSECPSSPRMLPRSLPSTPTPRQTSVHEPIVQYQQQQSYRQEPQPEMTPAAEPQYPEYVPQHQVEYRKHEPQVLDSVSGSQDSGHRALPPQLPQGGESQRTPPPQHPRLQDEAIPAPQPTREEPPRPPSPPMLIWNPAIEPPPNIPPSSTAFPVDTYFPNIWDQTPSKKHDQTHRTATSIPDMGGFFQPPPPSDIPQSLIRQGHYRQVTGEQQIGAAPTPDVSKVKHVFPWEDKPRHMPSRIFPVGDQPAPLEFISPESAPPAPSPVHIASPPSQPARPSPTYGLPTNLAFANVWDTVPSIQRYASRLIHPASALQPQPMSQDGGKRRRRESFRRWDERIEQNSRDADDEGEGEDDDIHEPIGGTWDEVSDEDSSKTPSKRGSRTGSISASYTIRGKRKEYRVRGVQTIPREMRSQGIQVHTTDQPKVSSPQSPERKPTRQQASSGKRQWGPATGSNLLPPLTVHDVDTGLDLPMTMGAPSPTVQMQSPGALLSLEGATPTGARSPREAAVLSTSVPVTKATPPAAPSPPKQKPQLQTKPSSARQSSDSSSITSPSSSTGHVSSPESQLPSTSFRKGGRVWDPARGVELFKKGSQEVLARFLRMGSWEEEH